MDKRIMAVATTVETGVVLEEIDFSDHDKKDRDYAFGDGKRYVVLIEGRYSLGGFSQVWFGWHYSGTGYEHYGTGGVQFDAPHRNACHWQKVWRVVENPKGLDGARSLLVAVGLDPERIRKDDEMRYAEARRQYAIDHGLVTSVRAEEGDPDDYEETGWKKVKITADSPIEAWLYKPTAATMPGGREPPK